MDSLRGSSVKIGTAQRRLAWQQPHGCRGPRARTTGSNSDFEEPSSVAGVAANRQADAFMCAHGSPLLGGKDSKYVRPFVRRKRLRSMLSALAASSDAATAASFWAGKTIYDLSHMVPDMSDALASMPQGMAVLDAAHMFQLDTVTGPLLLSMAACFWKNALAGKFGDLARKASHCEEKLRLAYEAYHTENKINANVSVLMGTRHVPEAMANGGSDANGGPAPSPARASSAAAPSSGQLRCGRPGSESPSQAKTKSPKAKAKARAKAKVPKETAAKAKAKVPKETVSKSEAKVSKDKARKGKASGAEGPSESTTLLNQ